jgi:adenylate kinase family enzyme
MKRILIIGSGGAGKSTLARRLGERTGIEVVHLDRLYWNPGWVKTEKEEWLEVVRQAIEKESWIIDGNFGGTFDVRAEAADTIIFLEIPRLTCLYRVIKRRLIYRGRPRPDMAPGCNEKIDLEFLLWIWNYPKNAKIRKEPLLERLQNEKNVVRLRSNREVENFLSGR